MIILILFASAAIFATVFWLLSFTTWKDSLKTEAAARLKSHTMFQQVTVRTSTDRKFKSIIGFEVKANLLVLDDYLLITPHKMSYKLFHTILPLRVEKTAVPKIKTTNWKAIIIKYEKYTVSLGDSTITIVIKATDKNQQSEIYNSLMDWSKGTVN